MQFGIATTILHSINTQLGSSYIILLLFIRAFQDNSTGKDLPITFIISVDAHKSLNLQQLDMYFKILTPVL